MLQDLVMEIMKIQLYCSTPSEEKAFQAKWVDTFDVLEVYLGLDELFLST